jgi:acetyltransferase-like isoleucine patch superfamily enzyme
VSDRHYVDIHGHADIHPTARLGDFDGENVSVWQFATICAGTEIGPRSVVGSCVWIGKNCTIGENVRIQHGAFIPNGSVIEDDVFIGPNVTMTDDKYPRVGNTGVSRATSEDLPRCFYRSGGGDFTRSHYLRWSDGRCRRCCHPRRDVRRPSYWCTGALSITCRRTTWLVCYDLTNG